MDLDQIIVLLKAAGLTFLVFGAIYFVGRKLGWIEDDHDRKGRG